MHHDGCGLTQGAAQGDIAGLGDAAGDIALARLVSRRREACPWPDLLRRGEACRIIDGGSVCQGYDSTDPGHRHQPTTHGVILSEVANTALQPGQLMPQGRPRPEHRICRRFKHGIAHSQFPDAEFELAAG
jgi:hypothetical protein